MLLLSGCVYDWPTGRIPVDQPGCGNDIIEPPEDCDGVDLAGETCESLGYAGGGTLGCRELCAYDTTGCISNSVCGDGTVAPDEECDDGNQGDGDGCSAGCEVALGWTCEGSPSVCTSGCGNGLCHLDGGEDHVSCPTDCGWIQISAGATHTCGLKADGTVWCWGGNSDGQLGDGTTGPMSSPVQVVGLADAVAVSAGSRHTCAIDASGDGYCWGHNDRGQLGNGDTEPSPTPVAVVGLGNAETVAAGESHSCATTSDQEAYCWGRNDRGQLGDDTTTDHGVALPVDPSSGLTSAVYITAGGSHTCALRSDDTALCWGRNDQGQLGDGSTSDSHLPAAVDTAGGFTGSTLISAGYRHTCARDSAAGSWCWGDGSDRRLGTGTTPDAHSPAPVISAELVTSISAGREHGCAVDTSAVAWCWGNGSKGELGSGGATPSSDPVMVTDATATQQISAGEDHSCAIMMDGTAWCWGANDEGQLGDSSTQSSNVPVMVDDPY